jgi:uncharacterized protein YjbI with pentapeptide repeats
MSSPDSSDGSSTARKFSDADAERLLAGVESWNAWRSDNPGITPALFGADLRGADLAGANLDGANLYLAKLDDANLSDARLNKADLSAAQLCGAKLNGAVMVHAVLTGANLMEADATGATLSHADLVTTELTNACLRGADLDFARMAVANATGADFTGARFVGASLSGANFTNAVLKDTLLNEAYMVRTKLNGANLDGSRIYGIAAWDVELDSATSQKDLIITPKYDTPVMVDDLEVAQFIYLIMNREKLRRVINTVTKKGVLILGRFGDGGIAQLQAIASWLRQPENGGYLPILCDFARPDAKTFTETVRTLAGMARFVIVDLSGPSVPQEITATVDLYEIPFIPILEASRRDWSMFKDFLVKERVFEPIRFVTTEDLFVQLGNEAIAHAERKLADRQRRLDRIFGSQ